MIYRNQVTKRVTLSLFNSLGSGIDLHIDTTDIVQIGFSVAASQICIFLSAGGTLFLLIRDMRLRRVQDGSSVVGKPLSTSTLHWQLAAFTFASLFSAAMSATVTHWVADKGAKYQAILPTGEELPKDLVDSTGQMLGIKSLYKDQGYREPCSSCFYTTPKLIDWIVIALAVFPWVGFLFCSIATLVTYFAWKRSRCAAQYTEYKY